jgi:hypothetical protein
MPLSLPLSLSLSLTLPLMPLPLGRDQRPCWSAADRGRSALPPAQALALAQAPAQALALLASHFLIVLGRFFRPM